MSPFVKMTKKKVMKAETATPRVLAIQIVVMKKEKKVVILKKICWEIL